MYIKTIERQGLLKQEVSVEKEEISGECAVYCTTEVGVLERKVKLY